MLLAIAKAIALYVGSDYNKCRISVDGSKVFCFALRNPCGSLPLRTFTLQTKLRKQVHGFRVFGS